MTPFPPKKSATLQLLASKGPRLFGDEGGELDMGKLALFRRGAEVATKGMEIKGDKKVMVHGSKKEFFFLFYGWHKLQALFDHHPRKNATLDGWFAG